ncbi:transposase [Komagataeibacter diospyri]|nr:transposase [Komagataeibacter diospyri]
MVFLDGTTIRAHHKAAGVAQKGDTEDASGIVRRLAVHVEALARGSA